MPILAGIPTGGIPAPIASDASARCCRAISRPIAVTRVVSLANLADRPSTCAGRAGSCQPRNFEQASPMGRDRFMDMLPGQSRPGCKWLRHVCRVSEFGGGRGQAIDRCRRRVFASVLLWTSSEDSKCTGDDLECLTRFPAVSALRPEVVRCGFCSHSPCLKHGALWRARWPRGLPRLKWSETVSCRGRQRLGADWP